MREYRVETGVGAKIVYTDGYNEAHKFQCNPTYCPACNKQLQSAENYDKHIKTKSHFKTICDLTDF